MNGSAGRGMGSSPAQARRRPPALRRWGEQGPAIAAHPPAPLAACSPSLLSSIMDA